MQPSLILPIILKDLRANRWLFAAFFAVNILSTASFFESPRDLGLLARSEFLKMSISLAAAVLFSLIYLLIMARVVHADPPASDAAFLTTRPVSGTTLFFVKLLLAAGGIQNQHQAVKSQTTSCAPTTNTLYPTHLE
jgi:hypothetical protein